MCTNLLFMQNHLPIDRTPQWCNGDTGLPNTTDGLGKDIVQINVLYRVPVLPHGVQRHWITRCNIQNICKMTDDQSPSQQLDFNVRSICFFCHALSPHSESIAFIFNIYRYLTHLQLENWRQQTKTNDV